METDLRHIRRPPDPVSNHLFCLRNASSCVTASALCALQFGPNCLPTFGDAGAGEEGLPPELRDCVIQ
jgi:hypothetical protein